MDPGSIDPDQLKRVRQFRKKLEEKKNILYFEYTTIPEFENEIRRHIREYARRQVENRVFDFSEVQSQRDAVLTERLISMLRSIVITVGRAVHELAADLPKLAGTSKAPSQSIGMLLRNVLRRADVSESELKRVFAPVGLEIRNIAADWVLQPTKRDEISRKVRLVLQEISDARSVLADLLPDRRKLAALTVNLTTAVDRYEMLVKLTLSTIDGCEEQLHLIIGQKGS